MHIAIHRQQIKSAMLPLAMAGGVIFYKWMGYLTFLSPYLIFLMLFITYCKLNIRDLKPSRAQVLILLVQMVIAAVAYLFIVPLNHTVAEGIFICIFIPTATAAPVITAMLGGSISFVATYSILCNLVVALFGPFILAYIGERPDLSFISSMWMILSKVAPLLILPMIIAFIVRYALPKVHHVISGHQQLSFYMWAISLFIIVGSCVSFVVNNWDENKLPDIMLMILGALIACLIQYVIGRRIGARIMKQKRLHCDGHNDMKVSVAQSLMQKNTVLGVWLALAYMNPLASVAPAAYIAWHNLVNSIQIWKHESGKVSG